MRYSLKKLIVFLGLVFQLTAFASQPEQKTLTIVLDWFINPNHAPLIVAREEGFFAQNGLKVKFITPADVTAGEKMVAAGKADIAITYEPALLLHKNQGLPLAHFATLIDQPLNCLIVLKESKIRSLKDLKGKKIGCCGAGVGRIIFSAMLKTAGLDLSDVQMINVKFNLVSALLTNKIDGFIDGMRNFEPLALKFNGKPVRVFYPEKYGFPKYSELILVTHKNRINDPSLVKFNSALKKGVEYLKKHPNKSWQKFAKAHPELNNSLNKKSWFMTLWYFSNNPARFNQKHSKKLKPFFTDIGSRGSSYLKTAQKI